MKSSTQESEYICPKYHSRYCFDECNWFGNCPDQERADALPENVEICSNCGKVAPAFEMYHVSTGRKNQPLCVDCYKVGTVRAGRFVIERIDKQRSR